MFRSLAKLVAEGGGDREQVLLIHPVQLSRWLDEAWKGTRLVPELPLGSTPTAPFLGDDLIIGAYDLPTQIPPALLLPSGIDLGDAGLWTGDLGPPDPAGVGLLWDHLIYAYLIESTGAFEIFGEVVRRLVAGETLGTLSVEGATWLRATEELFFRDPPLFSITGVVSEARPYARVARRNAYWRMFGLDLPHPVPLQRDGTGGRQEWKDHVGLGVNTDFQAKWAELLRQVYFGLVNNTNTSGPNPTDPSYVSFLCQTLGDMMLNRRRGGLLAREEFVYVTVLSWIDLTLETDTPIVRDLKAEATSPADRLSMMAQRVGMAPAARSRELFELAPLMSAVLRAIELGSFDDPTAASALYEDGTPLSEDMRDLIDLWQSASGVQIKEVPGVSGADRVGQPLRTPSPAPASMPPVPRPSPPAASVVAGNGHGRGAEVPG
jgi:hypothetical protein